MNIGRTHSSLKAVPGPNLRSLALCVSTEMFHILATFLLLVKLFQGMSLEEKTQIYSVLNYSEKSIMRQVCVHLQLKYMVVFLQWDVSSCLCSSIVTIFAYFERKTLTGVWRCLVLNSELNFFV